MSLHVKGMINIQFIVCDGKVYVIEVNPRSSRTVPYISKVTGIPIVKLATKCIIGHKIKELGYTPGLQPKADYYAIKMPVFSFEKIRGAETSLGPEMKSTGECLGIAKTFNEALYKAFLGAGVVLPKHKKIIMSVKDADKQEIIPLAKRFEKLGYEIYATRSTACLLYTSNNVPIKDARVIISRKTNENEPLDNETTQLEQLSTDSSGQTEVVDLDAPPLEYSLDENNDNMPYANYNVEVDAPGYESENIDNVEILPRSLAIQNVKLEKVQGEETENINIPPHTLYYEYPAKIPEDDIKDVNEPGEIVLSRVVVPEYIVVHDGTPVSYTHLDVYKRQVLDFHITDCVNIRKRC